MDEPWTQWLTWIFQAVQAFFLVAGYAGAVSWTHRSDAEGCRGRPGFGIDWPGFSDRQRRTSRWRRNCGVLGPDSWPVPRWSTRVGRSPCTWFLAVYLMVVSTPIAVAAQRRWLSWCRGCWRWGSRRWTPPRRRPRALPRLAELPAVLGAPLPARNRLARRAISRPQSRAARLGVGGRAGAAGLVGTPIRSA